MTKVWCVASLDPEGTERWCKMGRRVRGKAPAYQDHEQTSCCNMVVTLPGGYELREPTCDGREPEDMRTREHPRRVPKVGTDAEERAILAMAKAQVWIR